MIAQSNGTPWHSYIVWAVAALVVLCGAVFVIVRTSADAGLAVATANPTGSSSPSLPPAQSHWPTLFNLTADDAVPLSAADLPINNATAKEMSAAYGFFLGQLRSVEILKQRFPRYARQLETSQAQFDLRFDSAAQNIDRLLASKLSGWPTIRGQIQQSLHAQINPNALTEDDAANFVSELGRRAEGNVPSPILETFLRFHPTYMAQPAREMLDGYKREYRSAGTGTASGLQLAIQYPASWRATAGRATGVAAMFCSENGKGMTMALLNVAPLPPGIGNAVQAEDVESLRDARIWEQWGPNTTTLDSGVVTLAHRHAVWGEYKSKQNQVGIDIEMHNLTFIFIEGDRLVCVMFGAGAALGVSNASADDEFRRNGRLFQVMLNSFTVQNRSN